MYLVMLKVYYLVTNWSTLLPLCRHSYATKFTCVCASKYFMLNITGQSLGMILQWQVFCEG